MPARCGETWQHNTDYQRDGGLEMKLRRIIPLALAAFAGWKQLSPQQKASVKKRITGAHPSQPAP